jgi:hypothetical protein
MAGRRLENRIWERRVFKPVIEAGTAHHRKFKTLLPRLSFGVRPACYCSYWSYFLMRKMVRPTAADKNTLLMAKV